MIRLIWDCGDICVKYAGCTDDFDRAAGPAAVMYVGNAGKGAASYVV